MARGLQHTMCSAIRFRTLGLINRNGSKSINMGLFTLPLDTPSFPLWLPVLARLVLLLFDLCFLLLIWNFVVTMTIVANKDLMLLRILLLALSFALFAIVRSRLVSATPSLKPL